MIKLLQRWFGRKRSGTQEAADNRAPVAEPSRTSAAAPSPTPLPVPLTAPLPAPSTSASSTAKQAKPKVRLEADSRRVARRESAPPSPKPTVTVADNPATTASKPNDVVTALSETLIDRSVLKQLSSDTGPEVLPLLVNDFLEEMTKRTALLAEAVEGEDLEAIRHQAHTIKGSSATFGAMALSRVAKRTEFAASDGELALARTAFIELEKVVIATRSAFDSELRKLAA